MTAPSASSLKNKATKLHSLIVRARGACQHCGAVLPTHLQCAHIVSRRYSATRTDLDNAFCLCAGCHMFFTEWPIEFGVFVSETIGVPAYDALKRKAETGVKSNAAFWRGEVERLTAVWKTLEAVS